MGAILFGECVSVSETAAVRILTLDSSGCDLEAEVPSRLFDADFSLWIGAVGPFVATATRKGARHMSACFKEPLDGRILRHFNI